MPTGTRSWWACGGWRPVCRWSARRCCSCTGPSRPCFTHHSQGPVKSDCPLPDSSSACDRWALRSCIRISRRRHHILARRSAVSGVRCFVHGLHGSDNKHLYANAGREASWISATDATPSVYSASPRNANVYFCRSEQRNQRRAMEYGIAPERITVRPHLESTSSVLFLRCARRRPGASAFSRGRFVEKKGGNNLLRAYSRRAEFSRALA